LKRISPVFFTVPRRFLLIPAPSVGRPAPKPLTDVSLARAEDGKSAVFGPPEVFRKAPAALRAARLPKFGFRPARRPREFGPFFSAE